jgi:hypothetical protein
MVGMQQDEVIACMGAPARRTLESTGEVWVYFSGNAVTATDARSAISSNNFSSRLCDINIAFSNGQVSAVKFIGPIGGAPVTTDQCTNTISPCVKQR